MAATFLKNRFVGLSAGKVSGGFMTPVFYPQSEEIYVDADVKGWLRAEICDAWGRKIDGYNLQESVIINGDSAAHKICFNGKDTAGFIHDPIRIRFEYADAVVYMVES